MTRNELNNLNAIVLKNTIELLNDCIDSATVWECRIAETEALMIEYENAILYDDTPYYNELLKKIYNRHRHYTHIYNNLMDEIKALNNAIVGLKVADAEL